MASQLLPASLAGVKRPHSDTMHPMAKRQKVHRKLRNVQHTPAHIESASQDPLFAQGQLLKSIAAALVMAGFDGVKESAMEMFRSHVEEYILRFLSHARTSMHGHRRVSPTAQDFAQALAQMPSSSTASLLKPQLAVPIPADVSRPILPDPTPDAPAPPDLTDLLEPLMARKLPSYIPKHFPALPPQHTWMTTPVFPEREMDARKTREKATEEGMLAEQALRKLAAAEKAGKDRMDRRRSEALSGAGKVRDSTGMGGKARKRQQENTLGDLLGALDA